MKGSNNYILFIDESGKSTLTDAERYFLLSGLIINKDLHTALSSYMISLKNKSDIPIDENIHAFELFEDERRKVRNQEGKVKKNDEGDIIYEEIPYHGINKFFDRLSSLIDGIDMEYIIFRADKEPYKKLIKNVARKQNSTEKAVIHYLQRNDLDDILYESLARKMILEFGHFLEKEDAQGEVIAESRWQDDDAVLRAFVSATNESTYQRRTRYKSWARSSFKRIHSLTFQNKKGLSFGLEIADLFGWAHFNKEFGFGVRIWGQPPFMIIYIHAKNRTSRTRWVYLSRD
ncbi:MAG: DUF3800 domain-containing protein [Thermoproteota archaeon]